MSTFALRASSRLASIKDLPPKKRSCIICCQDVNSLQPRPGEALPPKWKSAKTFQLLCSHLNATYDSHVWDHSGTLQLCLPCTKNVVAVHELHEQIEILGAKLKLLLEGVCKKVIFTSKVEREINDYGYFGKGTKIAEFHNEVVKNVRFRGLEAADNPSEIELISRVVPDKWFEKLLNPSVSLDRLDSVPPRSNAKSDYIYGQNLIDAADVLQVKEERIDSNQNENEDHEDEFMGHEFDYEMPTFNEGTGFHADVGLKQNPPLRRIAIVVTTNPSSQLLPTSSIVEGGQNANEPDTDGSDYSWASESELRELIGRKNYTKRLSKKRRLQLSKGRNEQEIKALGLNKRKPNSFFTKSIDGRLFYKEFEVLKQESGYQCVTCSKICGKSLQVVAHIKEVHLEMKKCKECGKVCLTYPLLRQHLLTHDTDREFHICPTCGKPALSPNFLHQHKWTHMSQEEMDAEEAAGNRNPLKWKKKKSQRNPIPCRFCGKLLQERKWLVEHERRHEIGLGLCNEEQQPFICRKCPKPKAYLTEDQLRTHDRSNHQIKQDTFQCNLCLKAFPTKVRLVKHGRTHTGEKPHICEFCGKGFSSQSICRNHQEVAHEGVKPFRCDICFASFSWRGSLGRHKMVCKRN